VKLRGEKNDLDQMVLVLLMGRIVTAIGWWPQMGWSDLQIFLLGPVKGVAEYLPYWAQLPQLNDRPSGISVAPRRTSLVVSRI